MQLVDHGQLVAHEFGTAVKSDAVFSTPIQSGSAFTCTAVEYVHGTRQPWQPRNGMCMAGLRGLAASLMNKKGGGGGLDTMPPVASVVLGAGVSPKMPSGDGFGTVYVTGGFWHGPALWSEGEGKGG